MKSRNIIVFIGIFALSPSIFAADLANKSNQLDWSNIVSLKIQQGQVIIQSGPLLWVFIALTIAIFLLRIVFRNKNTPYADVETELNIGGVGKIKVKPNHENIQIAHSAWTELATRKASLPFDRDHDVIVEIYDSYYQLFDRLRELAKSIPAQTIRKSSDTQSLVNIMVQVLNKGLRPHLTQWHAKFRRWYINSLDDPSNKDKSPQEIQQLFPEYGALLSDLLQIQHDISVYTSFLKDIAHGKGE